MEMNYLEIAKLGFAGFGAVAPFILYWLTSRKNKIIQQLSKDNTKLPQLLAESIEHQKKIQQVADSYAIYKQRIDEIFEYNDERNQEIINSTENQCVKLVEEMGRYHRSLLDESKKYISQLISMILNQ